MTSHSSIENIKKVIVEMIRYVRDNLPSSGPASIALKNRLNVAKRVVLSNAGDIAIGNSIPEVMKHFKPRIIARDYSLINEDWKELCKSLSIDCPDDLDALISTIRSLWKKWDDSKKTKIFDFLNQIIGYV
jgi:hypothetical protein